MRKPNIKIQSQALFNPSAKLNLDTTAIEKDEKEDIEDADMLNRIHSLNTKRMSTIMEDYYVDIGQKQIINRSTKYREQDSL